MCPVRCVELVRQTVVGFGKNDHGGTALAELHLLRGIAQFFRLSPEGANPLGIV